MGRQSDGIGREGLIEACRRGGCSWGVPAAVDDVLARLEEMTVVSTRDGSVTLVGDWRAAGEELGEEGWCTWASDDDDEIEDDRASQEQDASGERQGGDPF